MKLLGFVIGYVFLVVGALLAFDAFIPKSNPIPFFSIFVEFTIGVAILRLAYFLIKKLRAGVKPPIRKMVEKSETPYYSKK